MTHSCLAANLPQGSSQVECAPGHPSLSELQRDALAEQIAAVDGITSAEAHRQIADFLRCELKGTVSS